ncbi:unnamed protein product, partial [Amoebophrya sp. A25]
SRTADGGGNAKPHSSADGGHANTQSRLTSLEQSTRVRLVPTSSVGFIPLQAGDFNMAQILEP